MSFATFSVAVGLHTLECRFLHTEVADHMVAAAVVPHILAVFAEILADHTVVVVDYMVAVSVGSDHCTLLILLLRNPFLTSLADHQTRH